MKTQTHHSNPKTILAFVRLLALGAAILPALASGGVLTTESFQIQSSGGSGGSGASTSDMIYNQYTTSDGWGWAGGAGGVQGSNTVTNTGGGSIPANETFKFNVGSTIDALNTTYGAGNWTISNAKLAFASSYSVQNNSRFGRGSGTFDIYWVANDNWAQSKGTQTPPDRQLNPVYATSEAGLSTWAGSDSLLGSNSFSIGAVGYVNLTYSLDSTSPFLNDIVTATAASNSNTSLYLMATSDTLGMIIFTGGQSQPLPTLSFDVVSVPEPGAFGLLAMSAAALGVVLKRRRK